MKTDWQQVDLNKISNSLQAIEKKIKSFSIGFTLWFIGWFFTIGYVGLSHEYPTFPFWQKLIGLILSYILWPIVLGWKLSGRPNF
jgi:hypothetical protein